MHLMEAPAKEVIAEQNAQRIERMLFRLGYRPDLKGFGFTRDAIMLLLKDRQMIFGITKTLYPEIARLNGTTASVVERGIRHATALAWEKQGRDSLREQFPENFDRPTNRTVLAFLTHFYASAVENETKTVPYLI